jgi:O-methyltransferase
LLRTYAAKLVRKFVYDDLEQYQSLMDIDHPDFIWMNYGLDADDFSWLENELDRAWKYQMNMARFTVRGLDLAGRSVLDVGSGRGGNCWYLLRYHKPRRIVGLDQSSTQISWCNHRFRHEAILFTAGDAQRLPFANDSFDAITNIESASHYPDTRHFYKEAHRALVPGGHFCISCNFADTGKEERSMQRVGFRVIDRQDITERVVDALEKNSQNLSELLSQMAATEKAKAVGSRLHHAMATEVPNMLRQKQRFLSWVLQKQGS